MNINTQMNAQDLTALNYKMEAFNAKLKEEQEIVSKNKLEEADFLKLMITQLKTQDPTKPMDDKQFIGQMAQFTSLKQMNELTMNIHNLVREFNFSKAVSLVNKMVNWTDNTGRMNQGLVESIRVRNGEAFLNIAGMEVSMNQLEEISSPNELPKGNHLNLPSSEGVKSPVALTEDSEFIMEEPELDEDYRMVATDIFNEVESEMAMENPKAEVGLTQE